MLGSSHAGLHAAPRTKSLPRQRGTEYVSATSGDDGGMGAKADARARAAKLHARLALESIPLGPLTLRGNDGLTKAEREADAARFYETVGTPGIAGMDRDEMDRRVAELSKPRPRPRPIRH